MHSAAGQTVLISTDHLAKAASDDKVAIAEVLLQAGGSKQYWLTNIISPVKLPILHCAICLQATNSQPGYLKVVKVQLSWVISIY